MWCPSTFTLLLCLSAVKVHCHHENEMCPRKEPPPGVLVLKLGSNVVLGCRGDVTVNDVPLVSATVHKKLRNRSEGVTVGFTTQKDAVYVDVNSINQSYIKGTSPAGTTYKQIDSGIYTKAKKDTMVTAKPSITTREDRPTLSRVLRDVDQPTHSEKVGGARQEEEANGVTMGTDFFLEEDEYDDYSYEEEGSRVTRGIKKRAHWTRNGRQVRTGGILRLPHLSLANSGNYSCYKGERLISTINISVGVSPERPTVSCYRKFPTSKVRCDWTSKQPVTPRPLCYLLLRKGFSNNVTQINCSFSRSRCWCAFPMEEGDDALYLAKLCVTNTAGNATSPEINFRLPNIIKPDPPINVEVKAVTGHNHKLRVSWWYPSTWKHGFYNLQFQLRYRPQQAENYQFIDGIIGQLWERRLSKTISDALPYTPYEIQLRAKDEFVGIWSDWTDTVIGFTWSNNKIPIVPEISPTFENNSWEMFPEDSGGSGEGSDVGSVIIVGAVNSTAVWMYVLWICGMCCFVALVILTVYFFRYKLRFVSKVGKESLPCSSQPHSSPPLTPTTLSEWLPEEEMSLMFPINHKQQQPSFLPDQQEGKEGIYLHNRDYFLTPVTEGVPLTISSSS